MGDVYDRKKRPFCVYKLLFTYTDDDNQLTMPEIISKLESDYGIFSERKAIYDDIKMLQLIFMFAFIVFGFTVDFFIDWPFMMLYFI